MKKLTTIILFALMFSLSAHAAVQAMLFHVSTNESFTVPAGKVLIIENIQHGVRTDLTGPQASTDLVAQNGTNNFQITGSDFCQSCIGVASNPFPLRFPLKFPEGWTIIGTTAMFPSLLTDAWIFALLVDASDPYAGLANRIDSIAVTGGTVALGVQMASARPAQISFEKSADPAKGWRPAAGAVVSRTGNPTKYTATLPAEGDKEFFRAKAVPLTK